MKRLDYTVSFLTPAFLGNAEQDGQWRTPPFKALLRQWWRVAHAAERQFRVDVAAMRREEGLLFGHAWLEDDHNARGDRIAARKSRVRIRLDNWSQGGLNQAPSIGMVSMGRNQIPAALYSAYGPVEKGPKLKANAAIQSGAKAVLRIAFPEDAHIEQALALINRYATIGGRSRNGWGSFELVGDDVVDVDTPSQNWEDAMKLDWPHAIGRDGRGALIWQSAPQPKWENAMRLLAQVRADTRRVVPDRLMLAHPDTKRTMLGWGKDDRVPNSLRFKVRKAGAQFVAVIFHVPCHPADVLWRKLSPQKQLEFIDCFSTAHAFLDNHKQFHRAEA